MMTDGSSPANRLRESGCKSGLSPAICECDVVFLLSGRLRPLSLRLGTYHQVERTDDDLERQAHIARLAVILCLQCSEVEMTAACRE